MPGKPPVALWFMGFEIVEDDVDLALGIRGDYAVHEVEEFDAASALIMAGCDLAIGDVECGEQCRGAVPPVLVRPTAEGAPVRQLQITLGAFQRLNMASRRPRPPTPPP